MAFQRSKIILIDRIDRRLQLIIDREERRLHISALRLNRRS